MKLRSKVMAAAVVAVAITMLTASVCFAWKFASTSDSQGAENGVNVAMLTKIINQINAEGVDLVIMQGDLVSGSSTDSNLASQYDTWLTTMSQLTCPFYVVPGNHDVSTATSEDVWRSKMNMPLNGPAGYEETVWSFNHQDAHFVGLNSNHYGEAHLIQQAWLENDLNNNTQQHVFVMCHEPAYSKGAHIENHLGAYPEQRDLFWNTLATRRCKVFFSGHEHYYSWSLEGSVYQCINGPSGGGPRTGFPDTIGQYNYVVVTVNGANLHGEAKNDNGQLLHTWDIVGDPTPPGPVSNQSAAAGNMQVTLSWTNPGNSDFEGTVVRCKTGSYPANPFDGLLVCEKTNTPNSSDSFVHQNLSNGTLYYYAVYAYDESRNYSAVRLLSSTPTGLYCVLNTFTFPNGPLNGNADWSGDAAVEEIGVVDGTVKITGDMVMKGAGRDVSCSPLEGVITVRAQARAGLGIPTMWGLWIDDPSGRNFARWYGGGTTVRGRIGGTSSATALENLSGPTVWDNLEVRIDTVANTSQFFLNGDNLGTLSHASQGAGDTVGRIRFDRVDNNQAIDHYIHLDNVQVGADVTPPGPVTGLQATGSNGQVALSWTKPTNSDLAGVKILFKTEGYPSDPTDGTVAYSGLDSSFVHGGLTNGSRYHYSAFAYDTSDNYSTKAEASAHAAADASIADAKGLSDLSVRALRGNVVSAITPGFFYLQALNELQGIKVISSDVVPKGAMVDVIGVIGGSGLERYVDCSGNIPVVTNPGPVDLFPVAMGNRAAGGAELNLAGGVVDGAGANNFGLLVKVWGKVTQRDKNLAFFYIDDGSGLKDGTTTEVSSGVFEESVGVRILADATDYPAGSFVTVTGVVSTFYNGGLRTQILPE